MKTSIEVIVQPDGTTRLETKGFVGPGCKEASRALEQALGKSAGEQLKSEYHQSEQVRQSATQVR